MATLEQEWEAAAPDLSADWEAAAPVQAEPASTGRIAAQSVAKGVAGVADMFAGAPARAANLGLAGAGYAAGELGRPDIAAEVPIIGEAFTSPVQSAMQKTGLLTPEAEPQTAGQRVLDRAIQTGIGVAVAPAKGLGELIKNMAVGALSGVTGGVTKEVTGSDLAALAVSVATPLGVKAATSSTANASTLKNPVKTETIQEAQAAGYVIPPSSVKPSGVTNRLESVAGKAAIKQEAAARNQVVTNKLAAKAIGLDEETILTPTAIGEVRKEANKAYDAISQLSPRAASALERLREVRQQATDYFKHYDRSADPASLKQARALSTQANVLERVIEKQAQTAGRPELVTELKAARTLIAKTHDVERALNLGDGNVSASVIGRMLDSGRPLTGELKVIGKFSQAFPSITREGASVPAAGVSALDPVMGTLLAGGGYAAAGGPAGLAAGALPLLRGPMRSALLSQPYQRRLLAEAPISLNQATLQGILGGREMAEGQ